MAYTLEELVARSAPLEELAAACDAMLVDERDVQVLSLSRRSIARLYELAAPGACQAAPAELALLVPSDVPAGHTVDWSGKNSLPAFSHFHKRFTRSMEPDALVGMNAQWSKFATGPGYFTAVISAEHPQEILFDYTRYPEQAPPGWPELHRNESGIGALVYGGMRDFVRPVGHHVLVGAAFRTTGESRNAYFALTRGGTLPIGN